MKETKKKNIKLYDCVKVNRLTNNVNRSISAHSFMNLGVFQQMRLLPERFAAHLAPERLFAGMRAQMNFDVRLI